MRAYVIMYKKDGSYVNGKLGGYTKKLDLAHIFHNRNDASENGGCDPIEEKIVPVELTIKLVK